MGFLDRFLGVGKGSPDPPALKEEIDRASAALAAATARHDSEWGLGGADWALDQDRGFLTFTTDDGVRAIAPAQIIGTFNTEDETWLWAWDHPSVLPALRSDAQKVLQYGQKHGFEKLTTRKLSCTELEAWELTALAFYIAGASGAYRGPSGSTMVFMTFGVVEFARESSTVSGS